MSPGPFSLSADLKRLRDEGYSVRIKGNLLILRGVPYVDGNRQVQFGTLISTLVMAGDVTCRPDVHTIWWDGSYPCNPDGTPIAALRHQDRTVDLGHGLSARHGFSNKPLEGYADYHHKMTTYVAVISGPATTIQPGVNARPYAEPEPEEESVFNFMDTASARAGIGALADRLAGDVIAIIGLGGSGSYVLDQVAKTPVREIRLFDADELLQHNAFRAPGSPSLDELREVPLKVDHFAAIYSRMHRGIRPNAVAISAANASLLDGVTFAFVCIDDGPSRRAVIEKLEAIGASFVDVGMGLELDDGSLGGILRVTASTPGQREHVHSGRIDFADAGGDVYASNIQVADLNALNAIMAVIKWKKLKGFYRDLEREHHSTYTTDGNMLINGDCS
ncbi:ThiF family adenylyltransferase [Novosphingobium rosa]|uniref:ThiF family adenylyltransferase n=1 Tax=Novosphingobium rosa TaxID=76978 RepID=UPI0008342F48|nr:ThiF family adenylyltransferase [Novosphingobium rosa]